MAKDTLKLGDEEKNKRMTNLPGWSIEEDCLKKVYSFPDFSTAIEFVDLIAVVAERERHHPDMTINYDKVTINQTTHKAGGLTNADFEMARKIEEIAGSLE